jgi:hypothetical protein
LFDFSLAGAQDLLCKRRFPTNWGCAFLEMR